MRIMRSVKVFLGVVAVLCLGAWCRADGQETGRFDDYYKLVESGDKTAALAVAKTTLGRMREAAASSRALGSIDARLRATDDAQARVIDKLDLIVSGVNGRPSAFAYISPTPRELYEAVTRNLAVARPTFRGLSQEETAFAKSVLVTAPAAADQAVAGVYRSLVDADPGKEAVSKARAYLSAYILAVHDEATFPEALRLAAKTAGDGGLPIFLAEDAVVEIEDFSAATHAIEALDGVEWASWPDGERLRLLRLIAERALETGQYDWAVTAYRKVVEAADDATAEEVQYKIIKIHTGRAKELTKRYMRPKDREGLKGVYKNAAEACGKYLERFNSGEHRLTVEYLKAACEYRAGNSEQAAKDARAFREEHPRSKAVPNVLLIEGLAASDLGKSDEAIEIYKGILQNYQAHSSAGRAAFLAGNTYLATQRYDEAREMFQKVVDFYPNDPNAAKAGEMVKKLSTFSKRE